MDRDIIRKIAGYGTAASVAAMAMVWSHSVYIGSFYVNRFVLWCLAICYLTELFVSGRLLRLKWKRENWVFVAMALFFVVMPVMSFFMGDDLTSRIFNRMGMERRYPFVLFAIIGICGWPREVRFRHVAYGLMVFPAIMVVRILIGMDWSAEDFVSAYNDARLEFFNDHMKANVAFNLALVGCFYVVRERRLWEKIVALLLVLPSVFSLIITEGRVGFVTMLVVLLIVAAYFVWRWNRVVMLVAVPLMIVGGCLLVLNHRRVHNFYLEGDPRFIIWPIAGEMIQEKPMGWGFETGRREFVDRCYEKTDCWFVPEEIRETEARYMFHPHNAFIEEQLAHGPIGLLLLLACLILPLILAKDRVSVFMVETVFGLQYIFEVFNIVPPFCMVMLITLLMYEKVVEN